MQRISKRGSCDGCRGLQPGYNCRNLACGRTEGGDAKDTDSTVSSIDSKPAKGVLTLWRWEPKGRSFLSWSKTLKRRTPNVHVKVTSIPWDSAHDKFQTAIAAGNGPDLA
ncbi:extracellular solute-binding protein [Bifidobacterium actinocoloniiforme]|uniref:extracellular solute-binding protein n=1 Tax=Bifidobacterium actinocoloniiforme TaxID=638619 RepID=UPI001F20912A|nr:extracellular solute-binding protein [Bifidobacterium actinocoloniiforme]